MWEHDTKQIPPRSRSKSRNLPQRHREHRVISVRLTYSGVFLFIAVKSVVLHLEGEKMKRNLFAFLILITFVFNSLVLAQVPPALKITTDEKKIADGVTAKQLSDYLYFVASDEMEGRDTPSRGLDTTAKFIAMNLSKWGFKPAGDDGTYFQKIALHRDAVDPSATSIDVGGQKFSYGDDIVRVTGTSSI